MSTPVILLIWEEIPERCELFAVPNDHPWAFAVRAAQGQYVNDTRGPDDAADRVSWLLLESEYADGLPDDVGLQPEDVGCLIQFKLEPGTFDATQMRVVHLVRAGFLL